FLIQYQDIAVPTRWQAKISAHSHEVETGATRRNRIASAFPRLDQELPERIVQPIDPEPGGAGIRGRGGFAAFEQQLGQALSGFERAGPKPLPRFDGPLRRAILGQQLSGIELQSLLKVRDGRANLAAEARDPGRG